MRLTYLLNFIKNALRLGNNCNGVQEVRLKGAYNFFVRSSFIRNQCSTAHNLKKVQYRIFETLRKLIS